MSQKLHPLFKRFCNMRQEHLHHGIDMAWVGFDSFVEDIESTIGIPHDLDQKILLRKDFNRGFEPGNLEWADRQTQGRRFDSTHLIQYQGRSQTLREWGREVGISYNTMITRYNLGWTPEQIITTRPIKIGRREYVTRK